MSGVSRLEQALVRFVDATLTDDLPAARLAFAEAQAHGLAEAGLEAEMWAALELRAALTLPDDMGSKRAESLLRQLRRGVGL